MSRFWVVKRHARNSKPQEILEICFKWVWILFVWLLDYLRKIPNAHVVVIYKFIRTFGEYAASELLSIFTFFFCFYTEVLLAEIFSVLKDISRPAISWPMTSQIFCLPKSLVPLQIMMITGSSSAVGIR